MCGDSSSSPWVDKMDVQQDMYGLQKRVDAVKHESTHIWVWLISSSPRADQMYKPNNKRVVFNSLLKHTGSNTYMGVEPTSSPGADLLCKPNNKHVVSNSVFMHTGLNAHVDVEHNIIITMGRPQGIPNNKCVVNSMVYSNNQALI